MCENMMRLHFELGHRTKSHSGRWINVDQASSANVSGGFKCHCCLSIICSMKRQHRFHTIRFHIHRFTWNTTEIESSVSHAVTDRSTISGLLESRQDGSVLYDY